MTDQVAEPRETLKFKQSRKPDLMTSDDFEKLENIQRTVWVSEDPPWIATDTRKDLGRDRRCPPTHIQSLIGTVMYIIVCLLVTYLKTFK